MPISIFVTSSGNESSNTFVTSSLAQKPILGTIFIESNIEEDIDMKNQKKLIIWEILFGYRSCFKLLC